jgi:hypothetical protein
MTPDIHKTLTTLRYDLEIAIHIHHVQNSIASNAITGAPYLELSSQGLLPRRRSRPLFSEGGEKGLAKHNVVRQSELENIIFRQISTLSCKATTSIRKLSQWLQQLRTFPQPPNNWVVQTQSPQQL